MEKVYTVLGLKRVSVSTDAHNENDHDVNNLTPNEFRYLSQKEKTMSDLPWNQDRAKGKRTGTKRNHTRPNAFRRPQRRAPARNSTECLDNQNSNKPIRDDIRGMINATGRRGQGTLRMPLRTCCVHVLVLNTFDIGIRVGFSERSSRHVLGRLQCFALKSVV